MHNLENSGGGLPSKYRESDSPQTSPPPPCPRVETASDRRSCNRAASVRSRCWAACQNIPDIRSSCPPHPGASPVPELWRRNAATFLPQAGDEEPMDSASDVPPACRGTARTALVETV